MEIFKKNFAKCFVLIVFLLSLASLTGCRTTDTVSSSSTDASRLSVDSVRDVAVIKDSVFVRDSIFLKQITINDTVIYHYHHYKTEVRDRWRTDTLYQLKTDTIVKIQKVETEKVVEKKVPTWPLFIIFIPLLVIVLIRLFDKS